MAVTSRRTTPDACPECGTRLRPNLKFCTKCGAKVEIPPPPQPLASPAIPIPIEVASKKNASSVPMLITGGACLAISGILLLIAAISHLSSGSETDFEFYLAFISYITLTVAGTLIAAGASKM